MYTAITSDRIARHGLIETRSRIHHEPGLSQCVRDNLRLAQENEQLRRGNVDLTAAAETWIRLYESALNRANAAEARLAANVVREEK